MASSKGVFRTVAERTSAAAGSSYAFLACIGILLVWAASGFAFQFSNTWQLIINTFTNVVTLLIVFLIQNTQNRDAKATHLKLDELIRAVSQARTHLVGLENLSDDALEKLQRQFQRIQQREARKIEQKAGGSAA